MAYGFDSASFFRFHEAMREYPERLPSDPDRLFELLTLYLAAMSSLLHLMFLIMKARLRNSRNGERFSTFLPIYLNRTEFLVLLVESYFAESFEHEDFETVYDFLESVRQGAIADEMVALGIAIDGSSESGDDAATDQEAGTQVTNSLKKQIEEHVSWQWTKDVLHAINEILSIVRGVT